MIRLIVLGPNALTRALVVTVLGDVSGLEVEVWDEVSDPPSTPPDLLILHDGEDPSDEGWLADHLLIAARQWPGVKTIVLTTQTRARCDLCRSFRVRACLPISVDVEQMLAVIKVVQSGYVIYSPELLSAASTAAIGNALGRFGSAESSSHHGTVRRKDPDS